MNKLVNLTKLTLLIFTISFLASCTKENNIAMIIPHETSFVFSVDAKAISEKTGIEDFTTTNAYKAMMDEFSEEEASKFNEYYSLISNNEESGINVNSKMYFFFNGDFDNDPSGGFTIPLIDKATFKTKLEEKLTGEDVEYSIVVEGDVEYLKLEDAEEAIVAWNNNQVLIYFSEDYDTEEELLNQTLSFFKNTEENSVAGIDNFNEFEKSSKDISLWINYGNMMAMMPPQTMFIYSQLPINFNETYAAMHIGFEKGEITGDMTFTPNKEFKAMLDKYDIYDNNFNEAILNIVPANNMINLGLSMNFEEYYNLVIELLSDSQEGNIENFKSEFEEETDMTIDDFIAGIGGSIYAGIYDFNFKEVEKTDWTAFIESTDDNKRIEDFKVMKKEPMPSFAVATDINDERIFGLIEKYGSEGMEKEGDYYVAKTPQMNFYLHWNDEIILLTNDSVLISDFAAGNDIEKALAGTEIGDQISDKQMYVQLNPNMKSYPEEVQNSISDSFGDTEITYNILSMFENIELYNNGAYNSHMSIKMTDKSKNALEVIFNAVDSNIDILSEK